MKTIETVALELRNYTEKIQLLYAFNSVGKTRLSVAYKDATKKEDGTHTGIYYNAYSEDLFAWNNDIENDESNIRLTVRPSNLSRLHADLNELDIHDMLKPYRVSFDFRFVMHSDVEMGIKSISFFPAGTQPGEVPAMKISRGEERIFVWCFFLAMMEVDGWSERQYIFIDDPVSSLDDHNIFVTALTLYNLIERHFKERKIIIATHHVGLFAILSNWLTKSDQRSKFKKETKESVLSGKHGEVSLEAPGSDVFLYHLRVLQVLEQARQEDNVRAYHLVLLRQVLENVSSFLGVGRLSHVLKSIGFKNAEEITRIVHTLAHKDVYRYESDLLVPDSLALFNEILDKLTTRYEFVIHVAKP